MLVSDKEVNRRAFAVEGALLLLITRLAERGTICTDEATEMLNLLSASSDFSAARVSGSKAIVERLQQLRGGDGCCTPGA
ncbi:MAG: hypothetical protein QHC90_18565 [Shinella sp.]|nr:hypothetical protein [Shinella sp.]